MFTFNCKHMDKTMGSAVVHIPSLEEVRYYSVAQGNPRTLERGVSEEAIWVAPISVRFTTEGLVTDYRGNVPYRVLSVLDPTGIIDIDQLSPSSRARIVKPSFWIQDYSNRSQAITLSAQSIALVQGILQRSAVQEVSGAIYYTAVGPEIFLTPPDGGEEVPLWILSF